MGSNKFFTLMIVPEKSDRVSKIVIPSYVFKGGMLSLAFLGVLAVIMVLDYANVMNQINENKQLRVENRQLKQSVQIFKTKMVTMENTLDRVKTFVTKLRIITNIEEVNTASTPSQALSGIAPLSTPAAPAAAPIAPLAPTSSGASPMASPLPAPAPAEAPSPAPSTPQNAPKDKSSPSMTPLDTDSSETSENRFEWASGAPAMARKMISSEQEAAKAKRLQLLAALMTETTEGFTLSDAENSAFVRSEFEKLDAAYDSVNGFALSTEQETQSILDRLGEKRVELASKPTLLPTRGGYISSGYGVRLSPFDGINKMHEGIDIANRYGADIIAPADGEVIFSGVKAGYGKLVILDHGNGLETRFAHNSKCYVNSGDRVKRGERIAAVGNTGHSTGPHCHYEVHANGLPVDPCYYILESISSEHGIGCRY